MTYLRSLATREMDCVADPRPVLFISPSARLARIPWGLLAVPLTGPSPEELVAARTQAVCRLHRLLAELTPAACAAS